MNIPDDFIDSSIKFRNISLSQNEKEMVSNTSPIIKTIVIDYFIEAIKKLNLKNPIIVSGDSPTYSTFSYTATEGDKVTPKYTRGISVVVTDWNSQLKAVGDVISGTVYSYDNLPQPGQPARKLEETTYGWLEQTGLEITFWTINSSRGRDIGGQFVKRTMLEGQKDMYFLKNGIMGSIPVSGNDMNDPNMLKNNGAILYQHVTKWNLTSFFYINTSIYEDTESPIITDINYHPTAINSISVSANSIFVEYTDSGAILYPNGVEAVPNANNDVLLNEYARVTLDRNNEEHLLPQEDFDQLVKDDINRNIKKTLGICDNCPTGSGMIYPPGTTTTTTTTSTTTTTTV